MAHYLNFSIRTRELTFYATATAAEEVAVGKPRNPFVRQGENALSSTGREQKEPKDKIVRLLPVEAFYWRVPLRSE